ncbi:MAG: hypothetical protein KKB29_03530 [Nanoarchaeota archaeon]|nr:hypothetical protein [Planctomycetota bacterium]MBU2459404.1 hypothetical protein [Nanoarchaeota archaeon]
MKALSAVGAGAILAVVCKGDSWLTPDTTATQTPFPTSPPSELAPTQFVEPGRILDFEKDQGLLSPEIKKEFEDFAASHPELEGRDVYQFVIQSPIGLIGFATHELQAKEIDIGIIAQSEDGKTAVSIADRALYVTAKDVVSGEHNWSRLLGLATPGAGEGSKVVSWFYLPEGYPKAEEITPLKLDYPVLAYQMPNNGELLFWYPSMVDGKPTWSGDYQMAMVASYNALPEGVRKVLFSLLPVEPTPTEPPLPEQTLNLLNQLPKDSYTYDATGLHITVVEGQVIDIPQDQMTKRLKAGQASPFQIYNESETAILFAFDAENKVWVDAAKVLQPDKSNLDSFIKVETQQEFEEIFRLEKLLLPPFPKDTYFPPLEEINRDYQEPYDYTPFGVLADLSKAPTRLGVNYLLWEDLIIYTEQVYNPADGSFSCLHFALPREEYSVLIDPIFMEKISLFLPKYSFSAGDSLEGYYNHNKTQFEYWIKNGYYTYNSRYFPKIKNLTDQWLTEGKVPEELEKIILMPEIVVYGESK